MKNKRSYWILQKLIRQIQRERGKYFWINLQSLIKFKIRRRENQRTQKKLKMIWYKFHLFILSTDQLFMTAWRINGLIRMLYGIIIKGLKKQNKLTKIQKLSMCMSRQKNVFSQIMNSNLLKFLNNKKKLKKAWIMKDHFLIYLKKLKNWKILLKNVKFKN